jgi:hypothetical protein
MRKKETSGTMPSYELEMLAVEQRKQLDFSLQELKARMHKKLNVRNGIRQHIYLASAAVALAGLMLGYRAGGAFTSQKTRLGM